MAVSNFTRAANLLPKVNGRGHLNEHYPGGIGFVGDLDEERFLLGEFVAATTETVYTQTNVAFAILGVNPALEKGRIARSICSTARSRGSHTPGLFAASS